MPHAPYVLPCSKGSHVESIRQFVEACQLVPRVYLSHSTFTGTSMEIVIDRYTCIMYMYMRLCSLFSMHGDYYGEMACTSIPPESSMLFVTELVL